MKTIFDDDYEIRIYRTKEPDGSVSTEFEVYDDSDRYVISGWHNRKLTDSEVVTEFYKALAERSGFDIDC